MTTHRGTETPSPTFEPPATSKLRTRRVRERRAADVAAFEALYASHGARMKSLALNLLGNRADAEDHAGGVRPHVSAAIGDMTVSGLKGETSALLRDESGTLNVTGPAQVSARSGEVRVERVRGALVAFNADGPVCASSIDGESTSAHARMAW
jgi:DUF4097 and DUF4098 domain-containing protein YvlB